MHWLEFRTTQKRPRDECNSLTLLNSNEIKMINCDNDRYALKEEAIENKVTD